MQKTKSIAREQLRKSAIKKILFHNKNLNEIYLEMRTDDELMHYLPGIHKADYKKTLKHIEENESNNRNN